MRRDSPPLGTRTTPVGFDLLRSPIQLETSGPRPELGRSNRGPRTPPDDAGGTVNHIVDHSPAVGENERQALSSWQALQVVQAALLEIESGRVLSDAGRRRTFEALACVAQAVAA